MSQEINDVFSMVYNFNIKVAEDVNTAILGEIQTIALENGIAEEVVLNKQAITQVLLKSQKRKPLYAMEYGFCCPCCAGKTLNQISRFRTNYCPDCGQALEWEA